MFTFVGEKKSPLAIERGWCLADGRLAAKQLFDALRDCGLDPAAQFYVNLFEVTATSGWRSVLALVADTTLVAMGQRVHEALAHYDVPHVTIVHPAARGAIRRKDRYARHLKEALACL